MVAHRDVRAGQIARLGNTGIPRNHNRCFANAVSFSPHNAFFNLRRLVYCPMASTADIAGALAFVPVSFGIALERSKPVVIKRNRGIDSGESRRILAASFYIELVVETFFSEIALFISDPIIEPAMRLNYEFRHTAVSPLIISIAMLWHHLPRLQMPDVMPWAPTTDPG